jgi:hypothetical protein
MLTLQFSIPSIIFYNICVCLPKLSLCFTYLRLFISRKNTYFCYITIGFLSCWLLSATIVTIFECRCVYQLFASNTNTGKARSGLLGLVGSSEILYKPLAFLFFKRLDQQHHGFLGLSVACAHALANEPPEATEAPGHLCVRFRLNVRSSLRLWFEF